MPQVKDPSVRDGWYVNRAQDGDGKPMPLSLGAVYTFKPGQERFLRAEMILQSRATHQAFAASLANGRLAAKGAPVAAPEPPPPLPPPPEDPPEDPGVEDPPGDDAFSRSDLQGMNKAGLIELAEDMGLDSDGTKAELVDRILVNQE